MFKYESRHQPLLSRRGFARRMLGAVATALIVVTSTMIIGTVGFWITEGFTCLDGALNSMMIITGNGPAFTPLTGAGKAFTTIFALVGVIAFVSVLAVLLVPVIHRIMHRFHLDPPQAAKK